MLNTHAQWEILIPCVQLRWWYEGMGRDVLEAHPSSWAASSQRTPPPRYQNLIQTPTWILHLQDLMRPALQVHIPLNTHFSLGKFIYLIPLKKKMILDRFEF